MFAGGRVAWANRPQRTRGVGILANRWLSGSCWLSAVRLRSTMRRRDVGNSIAAEFSKEVSVRETVSIVKPR